jgi:hypothetical protein
VKRTLAAWLVALSAAALGVLGAHAAAYALLREPLGATHGYLPVAQAVVCALLAVAFAAATAAARSGALVAPGRAIVAVAPIAFLLQEAAERGALLPLDGVVLLGLVLQLPVGLLAYAFARVLLRAAEALARRRPRLGHGRRAPRSLPVRQIPRPWVRAAYRGRAPPRLAAS